MKIKLVLAVIIMIAASCSPSLVQIGKLNMLSNRNIDKTANYQLISSYSGGIEKELKKTKAETLEEAIDQTVKKYPGGEYLMNVKVYAVKGKYYAAEGDVWGIGNVEREYRGFKVGDSVTWKKSGKFKKGKITGFKNEKESIILTDDNKTVDIDFTDLTKL